MKNDRLRTKQVSGRHSRAERKLYPRRLTIVAAIAMAISPNLHANLSARAGLTRQAVSYIVHFSTGLAPDIRMTALSAVGAHLTGKIDQLDLAQVSMRPSALPQLLSSPGIEWAERESVSHTLGKPNDPLISEQWAPQKIGVFNAWRTEKGTKSTIVAVVDTGVDPSHPDLQNRLLPGYDFVNADQDPSDDHGHGTHVAGIIAARPDNRTGISGMSWGARILPLKACDSQGACGNFEVTAAIVRAIQEKAQVVNLSLGAPGESCPREFDLAAQLAQRQNVLLVAAAGNSAQEGNPTSYPAACDGYVAVGATSPTDEWATFSEHGDYVDVAAPGVMILSTVPPALLMQDDPSTPGYGFADGTSMATPHVAGLAALLFSQHPDWQPSHVQHRIESTAVDLGARGRDPYFGAGRIDVRRAVGRR